MHVFEETVPKLSIKFGNRNSQDSHKKQYPGPALNFGFTEPQMLIKFAAEVPHLYHW